MGGSGSSFQYQSLLNYHVVYREKAFWKPRFLLFSSNENLPILVLKNSIDTTFNHGVLGSIPSALTKQIVYPKSLKSSERHVSAPCLHLAARMEDAVRVRHHLQPAPGPGAALCRGLRASSRRYHRSNGQAQLPERTQDWIKLGGKVRAVVIVYKMSSVP